MNQFENPDKMSVIQLYEHHRSLEQSQPLLAPESAELVEAELETIAETRSEKIDQLYCVRASHERALRDIKEEEDLLKESKTHHASQLERFNRALRFLGRMLPATKGKSVYLQGNKYQFVLTKKSTSSGVVIGSNTDDWTDNEKLKFLIEVETQKTTKTVVRSITGEVLDEKTTTKNEVKLIPNEDALRNANQANEHLPQGVKIYPTVSIRAKRNHGDLDLETSEHSRQLLSEIKGAEES